MICILCERNPCIEDEVTCDDCTDYDEYIEEDEITGKDDLDRA